MLRGMGKFEKASIGAPEKRVEHVALALFVEHIVEERTELRAGELDTGVGDDLHNPFEVYLLRRARSSHD